jgi:gamma-glutamylcyclotransferase (GGCT)/AIG2-like uncharacterized protein YtfP
LGRDDGESRRGKPSGRRLVRPPVHPIFTRACWRSCRDRLRFPHPLREETAIATTTLFVYGTLKRGLSNHRLVADQTFLGEAATEPRYRVFDLGPYPGLVADDANGLAVKGELWAVSECCLADLDDFEEDAGAFARGPVAVAGRGGVVFAYFWNRPVPPGAGGAEWPLPAGQQRGDVLPGGRM